MLQAGSTALHKRGQQDSVLQLLEVTEITETRNSYCFNISVGLRGRCCRPYHL